MKFRLLLAAIAGLIIPFYGIAAQETPIAALSSIEPGFWELRSRGGSNENRSLCVTDPGVLLKVQHESAICSRFVIHNDQRTATVQYSCTSGGNGRTTIRVETPRLVQIETQGVLNREPFAVQLEGRRLGQCGVSKGSFRR